VSVPNGFDASQPISPDRKATPTIAKWTKPRRMPASKTEWQWTRPAISDRSDVTQ